MAPGTSPTFTESSRLLLYFLGIGYRLCNAQNTTEHWDTSITGDVSRECLPNDTGRGEKKGVGHYLPFASSMCFILSGNSKLACVSHLLVGKIFLGYVITSSPHVITGIRDPRRWMVLCLSGLHVDEAVPEPTVLINNVCLYWADNWIWNVGMG